jgi:hypothetical protein
VNNIPAISLYWKGDAIGLDQSQTESRILPIEPDHLRPIRAGPGSLASRSYGNWVDDISIEAERRRAGISQAVINLHGFKGCDGLATRKGDWRSRRQGTGLGRNRGGCGREIRQLVGVIVIWVVWIQTDSIHARLSIAADHLSMGAAPLTASVNCAGIAIVAFARMEASSMAVAYIIGTGIAVIAFQRLAGNTAACGRIALLNTIAGIAVIAILGGIDTYCSVKRIIGTGFSIIAIPGSVIAYSLVAVIISAGISIRAIEGQVHTLLAIESILCTRIMVITFMMMKRI